MKRIKILKNGPYRVTDTPLDSMVIASDGGMGVWEKGRDYDAPEVYHLCRCGHSQEAPFCDGAHMANHFDGTERAGHQPFDERARLYRGKTIDLLDNIQFCAVARFCDRADGVWQNVMDSGDPENAEIAKYEACACPAGRLVIVEKDGTRVEPELEPGISLVQDPAKGVRGPLWVKGGIEIEGADGTVYEARNRVTLCRCGESGNMPFCDASHLDCPHMRGEDK